MSLCKPIKWLYHEFGIASVRTTGRDAWLIILARTGRMFAYGGTSLIIALFFASLQFSDFQIGLFMTLTLAGDVVLSLLLTLAADRIGRRRVLFAGAFLMALSGAVFAVFEDFWILLLAAILGVISATGSDFGPFRSIEESTLSHLTMLETRADVLSWYVTTSSLGSAAGTEFAGRAVDYLQTHRHWPTTDAYHAVFWLYILTGAMCMICTLSMSDRCELALPPPEIGEHQRLLGETQPEGNSNNNTLQQQKKKNSPFSQISSQTRTIMYQLWFLLILDSLADGMVPNSLTNYYLDQKFHLPKSTLGDIMSTGYFLSSISTVFAGPLARRLGLINTMVFTHLPSSTAVLLFPIPQGVALSVVLFFIRIGLNSMDQAPRSAFIAAVVRPEERTAVMGITGMLRTLTSMIGPSVTGLLAGGGRFWVAFVVAGALRIGYDFGLFGLFVNMRLHAHEQKEEGEE
ncbi:major facilitator superfamily domain-containing protein [Aspergillus leporis]|uniref:Major facilitator superfamily domain-containing protein n=1 Tax=Aspergillus leporis TaxID=41062 RepID=A0A5N5WR19_9EURO|nr:major facilitator superfamily domain-containing protein [Aspergillus leporis]